MNGTLSGDPGLRPAHWLSTGHCPSSGINSVAAAQRSSRAVAVVEQSKPTSSTVLPTKIRPSRLGMRYRPSFRMIGPSSPGRARKSSIWPRTGRTGRDSPVAPTSSSTHAPEAIRHCSTRNSPCLVLSARRRPPLAWIASTRLPSRISTPFCLKRRARAARSRGFLTWATAGSHRAGPAMANPGTNLFTSSLPTSCRELSCSSAHVSAFSASETARVNMAEGIHSGSMVPASVNARTSLG